jgi:hypothetical protein
MKVKELIEVLKTMNPEAILILQRDSEGNGYRDLCGADDNNFYVRESSWYGEVYDGDWSCDDACMTEEEWKELKKNSEKCVVLYPIN